MNDEKYRRSILLLCPTCGGSDLEYEEDQSTQLIECVRCGHKTTQDGLIRDNAENISANVEEMKREVSKEVGKEIERSLKKALSSNKFIKVK